MIWRALPALAAGLLATVLAASPALAHETGTESSTPSQCSVLPGSAMSGPQAECMRCVGRGRYHYHSELPRRQRCHRTSWHPPAPRHHRHH
jgi:hypothetical protein